MNCPEERTLASFVHRRLDPARARALEAHFDDCDDCRRLVFAITSAWTQSGSHSPAGSGRDPAGGRLGRFVVLESIGAGAMGEVFAAYDPELDRKVAIKLLGRSRDGSDAAPDGWARLIREAKAMASLSHSNVLTVHEVGTFADEAFIAMEFAPGGTLRQWCSAEPRATRQILDKFLAAGRGLVAAHDAGLVHRDFKPDNVLLTGDGTAKVADFGLVGTGAVESPPALDSGAPPAPGDLAWTRSGGPVGTPSYMALEQHRGERAGPLADQFAYCVALWEALHGRRPFVGGTYRTLVEAVEAERIDEPPLVTGVPAWLRDILRRGLRANPEQRWPTMRALLDALQTDPDATRRQRIRRAVAAVGVVSIGALAVVGLMRSDGAEAPALCTGSEARLAGVWDPAARQSVATGFRATGAPLADDTFTRVAGRLDAYAAEWATAHRTACEATHVRGEQSMAVLDQRMACLDRRRRELGALAAILGDKPDRQLVERGLEAASKLSRVADCADPDLMALAVPLPEDPAVRAAIAEAQEQLDRATAFERAGKMREGMAAMSAIASKVEAIDYAPLRGDALYMRAVVQEGAGLYEGVDQLLLAALSEAAAARDDVLAARIWSRLVTYTAARKADIEGARRLIPFAEAAGRRIGERSDAAAGILHAIGRVHFARNELDIAQRYYERALAIRERVLGADHPETAWLRRAVGSALLAQGHAEAARKQHERVVASLTAAYGPDHVQTAGAISSLADALLAEGRLAEARVQAHRALVISEHALGPDHQVVGLCYAGLADVALAQGDLWSALAFRERARVIWLKAYGDRHPTAAIADAALAEIRLKMGQLAEAERHAAAALRLYQATLGPTSMEQAGPLQTIARIEIRRRRWTFAQRSLERALALLKPHDKSFPSLLKTTGELALARGRHADARAAFERALGLQEKLVGRNHPQVAVTLTWLAQVHLGQRDPAGALELATRAVRIHRDRPGDPAALLEAERVRAEATRQQVSGAGVVSSAPAARGG